MDREEILFSGLDIILYILALVVFSRNLRVYSFQKILIFGALIRLLIIFVVVINLYSNYGVNIFGNDSLLYFSMGKGVAIGTFIESFGSSGTTFIINFSGLIQKILPVSYAGMAIFSFILLTIAIPKFSNRDRLPIDLSVFSTLIFFSPTLVYWSAPFSKETFVLAATFISISAFFALMKNNVKLWLPLLAFSIVIMALFRLHMIPLIVLPHAVAYFFRIKKSDKNLFFTTVYVLTMSFLVVYSLSLAFSNVGIYEVSEIDDRVTEITERNSIGGSVVSLNQFERPFVFFLPFPYQIRNLFDLILSLESLIYAILLLRSLLQTRNSGVRPSIVYVSFCLAPILYWTIVYGYTASNFGQVARMKMQIMPYVFLLSAHLAHVGTEKNRKPLQFKNPVKLFSTRAS
jgi:hypothetical protein